MTAIPQTPKQSSDDVFLKKSYVNSGNIALAVSLLGIPATYIFTKRSNTKALRNMQKAIDEMSKKIADVNKRKSDDKLVSKKSKLTTILLGIGSGFGISEFIQNNREDMKKQYGYTDDEINDAGKTAAEIIEKPKQAIEQANRACDIVSGLNSKADAAIIISNQAKSTADTMDMRINDARNRADEALGAANSGITPEHLKFVEKYYDLWIMKYPDWEKKINNGRSNEAMDKIHNAAIMRLDRSAENTLGDIKAYKETYKDKLTSLWQISSENKPIKSGGLGDVPPDLQDNFNKLGIDSPIFVPMYETPGTSSIVHKSLTSYRYKGKNYDLQKIAGMDIEVFRNGKAEYTPVEFYLYNENGKKVIFVRNEAFRGHMYDSTHEGDEPEKFIILTKAVYNLAKAKVAEALGEPGSIPSYIDKGPAYDELAAPNSMILNDWQAGTEAALLRYRAPMEYNYDEIGEKVFKALSEMPLLTIGHNLRYQGASNGSSGGLLTANNNVTQNMINTLFGKFALGVVQNAHSGLDNEDMCNTILMKRTTADKQLNSLFAGMALSDWIVPVSKNYANELVQDVKKSGIIHPLLQRRQAAGTLCGIINGIDKSKHGICTSGNKELELSYLDYDEDTDIDKVMQRRAENKRCFYNKFIASVIGNKKTIMGDIQIIRPDVEREISEEEFMSAPIISFAHRLGDDQKGLEIFKGAIFRLFDNWTKDFGDKQKPIILVGGPEVNGVNQKCLYDLKNPDIGIDKTRAYNVIAMKGFLPNPSIMAASTFFCAPSTFEPCGLTQGECFAKGTPVIVTDTGGYHDTVIDGKTGYLAPYISEQSLHETMVRALKTYYYEPEKYKEMIKNDLAVDFSWMRKGRQGSIYEYTDKLGFDRKDLPDMAEYAGFLPQQ